MPKKKAEEVVEQLAEEVTEISKKVKKVVEDVAEDLSGKDEKKDKLAKLKEKAEKLAGKIKSDDTDLSKKAKSEGEEAKYHLAPVEDYLKSSMHLGTRAITPDMRPYIYKRRADSLAVFNTVLLDEKLKEGGEYLAKFAPEDVIIVCKRDAGAQAVELFGKVTGIKTFVKNYPTGILTNPNLNDFFEIDLLVICDPWTDKTAFDDAKRIKIPVLAICDANNYTQGITKIIPGNNKSAKSLGFMFYHLAKIYNEKRKIKTEIPLIAHWVEGWDTLVPPK